MTDIFNSEDQTTETGDNQNTAPDPFAELVGEGKKFKTQADLARGKIEADAFIEKLKKENEALRRLAEKKDYAEELLSKLQEKAAPPAGEPVTPKNNNSGGEENSNRSALTDKDIQRLVEEAITVRESKATAAQNLAKAGELAAAEFGDNAKAVVQAKAKELGLSVTRLQEIAAESPTAFMSMLGAGQKKQTTSVVNKGSVSTASFNSTSGNSGERNQAYYRELRKTNRTMYMSPAVQAQMIKDAERLGDKFFS